MKPAVNKTFFDRENAITKRTMTDQEDHLES